MYIGKMGVKRSGEALQLNDWILATYKRIKL